MSRIRGTAREVVRRGRNILTAGLDAARMSADTFQHWWGAKSETPLSVVPPYDRETVATKARYEFMNNEIAIGFADTYELYIAGIGPRLRFVSPNKKLNKHVEKLWKKWAKDAKVSTTLRSAASSMVVFGEAFNLISYNPERKICGLSYTAIDPLRVGNPAGMLTNRSLQDGVFFDEYGNVLGYAVYRSPENDSTTYDKSKWDFVPKHHIHHVFRRKLPEMPRGYSGFAPLLEPLGRVRDYRDNVTEAARTSAGIVAVATTQEGYGNGFDGFLDFPEKTAWYPGNSIPFQRNRAVLAPPGSDVKAFVPSQPTTNAADFIKALIALMGRALGLSRRHSTGDSAEYNFTSGRLDNQSFELLVSVIQDDYFEADCLDPLFETFYEFIWEELLIKFGAAPDPSELEYEWIWPTPPAVDPEANARADAIALTNGLTTIRRTTKKNLDTDLDDIAEEMEESAYWMERYGKIRKEKGAGGEKIEPAAVGTRIAEPEVSGGAI